MDRITCFEERNNFLRYLRQERHVSPHTYAAYQRDLDQFFAWWQDVSERSLMFFGPVLHEYIGHLGRTPRLRTTIARKVSAFNSFIRFLKRQKYDIAIKLQRPSIANDDPETLESEQIQAFFDSIRPEAVASKFLIRDLAIIELIYATGLRSSDIVQLEIGHIDFSHRTIYCAGQRQRSRVIPFGKHALEAVKAYLKIERPTPRSHTERFFLNFRGLPLTARTVQRVCVLFRKCASLPVRLTPRVLRASCAQHLIENGAQIEIVQSLLGHKVRISTEKYKK